MADIYTGNGLTLSYNTDTGNRSPQGVGNVSISNVVTFPVLAFSAEVSRYETYDSSYQTALSGDKSASDIEIGVAYVPTDPTHQFLDEATENQTEFQLVINYRQTEGTIDYAIVNGVISNAVQTGGTDAVVTKTYTFGVTEVVSRVTTANSLLPLNEGDYGIGSNGIDIPHYETDTPTGNGFIKVPSSTPGNPASTDLLGVGVVDSSSTAALVMTKAGSLGIFARNQSTAWSRIYTASQIAGLYTPLTRTVNRKPLSDDIVLTPDDVGAVPKERTVNGYALSNDIVLSKGDVGLSDVQNAKQLVQASNLSDVPDAAAARKNLDVLSSTETANTYAAKSALGTMATQNANQVVITGGNATFNSTANNPLTLLSPNPTIKFQDTDAGSTPFVIVNDMQSFRIQETDAGGANVFSYDAGNKTSSINNLVLRNALGLESGGTGASSAAAARANLGLSALVNNGVYSILNSPDGVTRRLVLGNDGLIQFQDASGNIIPLPIASGGTGARDVDTARSALNLGLNQAVSFYQVTSSVNGQPNGGIIISNRNNSSGSSLTYSRFYNEIQNDVAKTTLHTANVTNNKNAYLQYDENANLTGLSTVTSSGAVNAGSVFTTGYVTAAQGQRVGLSTQSGGNKDIYLANLGGDSNTGNWVNLIQGNWYDGYWQLGAVRGSGTNFDHIKLGVNNQGTDWKEFKFYNSYNGHIVNNGGYRTAGYARGWASDADYMGASFYADTVIGNDNGYNAIVAGGTQSSGGYSTRCSFGLISGGSANWPQMALHMQGDGTYHRGFVFSMDGNINSWDSPNGVNGGSFVFSRAATSDRTLKRDIVYTDGKESFERVQQWLPTMFKYKGQDTQRYGLIAQDLEEIDLQYVKRVKGAPLFEIVEETDEETGETKTVSRETGEFSPDTLALDNNVLLTDLACAFRYVCDKHQNEINELKALVQSLLDNK